MIGLFDSGSGGLTVARAIREIAPTADLLYFGDVANAPYGNKDQAELITLTLEGFGLLRTHGAEQIVSACNSISTAVIRPMVQLMGSSAGIIEMVEPTAREAALSLQAQHWIGVATNATVESGSYQEAFAQHGIELHMHASADLAGAIEQGASEQELQAIIDDLVRSTNPKGADRFLLGCTHYPLVRSLFEDALARHGSKAHIVDPAEAVAKRVVEEFDPSGTGRTKVLTSKLTPTFMRRVHQVLGAHVDIHLTDQ